MGSRHRSAGNIKDQWQAFADLFHGAKTEHINQVVIAHTGTTLTEHYFLVTVLRNLSTILPIWRGLKTVVLNVTASVSPSPDQIGLAGEECRQLDNIADFSRPPAPARGHR